MKTYQRTDIEKKSIKKKLASKLKKRPEILFGYIHGSFLDGAWFRDIDLAVYLLEDENYSEDTYHYEHKLSRELENFISLPVDIKILNNAPLSFCYQVSKGEVLTSRNEDIRTDFLERTWLLYLDLKPIREEYYQELLKE